ncbi:hypothetical protein PHSY_000994 [Pseudozyma hubeiensis SY62]|uniref:Uncharacterized protein n=1 Tax=Pseudozyma hubeiensis (strain SY62) TaxID=1305764 RepID=R9NXR4_PSEHS|nr:hypothetical protein PHSY_000994 [Pseudozyma hubeiensis SY62]GAC93429.1 hypothetical protein PHSY_000994 [Pseudozyma hubeiensis SY62]
MTRGVNHRPVELFANTPRRLDDGNVLDAQSRTLQLHRSLRVSFLDPDLLYLRYLSRLQRLCSYLARDSRLVPLQSATFEKLSGAATSAASQWSSLFLNMIYACACSSSIRTTTPIRHIESSAPKGDELTLASSLLSTTS